jgi:hypoxanthine phosphoribosyltransferase
MIENIKVKISEEQLQSRIEELASEISKDFKGESVTLLCILKGAVMFMVDLAKRLDLETEYEFMEISSYGDSQFSTGIVKITKDLKYPITGKNVIVIEDIIDTGKTISYLMNHFKAQKPKTLKICALLDKPSKRVVESVIPDYIGFEIPDWFAVGYGLDYEQKCRNLPYIGVIEK